MKSVEAIMAYGIEGDAHAGSHRPVSLLPFESFSKLENPILNINPGDFAENITTIGIDFEQISIGDRLVLGDHVVLRVIQIGKECHDGCVIKRVVGDCIMPREGVFADVIEGGMIRQGDSIRLLQGHDLA